MGNNHVQNLDFFLSSSCLMQLAAPFIQKSLALRRVDSIYSQILTNPVLVVGCWLPLIPALRFHYLCLHCPVRLSFQLCIHTIVLGFPIIYPVFSQRFVGFSIQLLRLSIPDAGNNVTKRVLSDVESWTVLVYFISVTPCMIPVSKLK